MPAPASSLAPGPPAASAPPASADASSAEPSAVVDPSWTHPRYALAELLGQGGMGRVYRAKDRLTGAFVALKRVHLHGPQRRTRRPRRRAATPPVPTRPWRRRRG